MITSLNAVSAQGLATEFDGFGIFSAPGNLFELATRESSAPEERERIETERHDFTQSTTTVGRGVAQLEFGYTYFYRDDGAETEESHATPELMLRYGLTEDLEFRMRYNNAWQFGEEDLRGSEDLRWAIKFRATDQEDWLPESAVELRFATPTGTDEWSTDDVEFGFDYIYGWRFSPTMELYGSTGFSTNALGEFAFAPADPGNDDFILYTQSVALGVELTEQVSFYSEFFGLFTDGFEDSEESPIFFNVGVDYYVNDDFVLDARIGTGLNDDAEDLFVGVGGAFRF